MERVLASYCCLTGAKAERLVFVACPLYQAIPPRCCLGQAGNSLLCRTSCASSAISSILASTHQKYHQCQHHHPSTPCR